MKKAIITVIAVLGLIGVYKSGQESEKIKDAWQGKKSYIVMTEKGKIGVLSSSDAEIVDSLKTQEGYVIKATEKSVQKLKDSGVTVYENRTYYANQISGCTPLPKPGPVDPIKPDPIDPVDPGTVGEDIPWGTAKIKALQAQARATGNKVRVCVIDTGVAPHEDITIVNSRSFVSGEGAVDTNGHGTHVAGTIAATKGNKKGIVGVAAGVAEIVGVKVLGRDGSGSGADIADGIFWSVDDAGCEVINMSLGSARQYGADPYIKRATDYAVSRGVAISAAAGNDSQGTGCGYPAANQGVYCISALAPNGKMASFSTHGPDVDYILPGQGIVSLDFRGGYVSMNGTSMAAPHFAGILALCKAANCKGIKATSLGLTRNQEGNGLPDAELTVGN